MQIKLFLLLIIACSLFGCRENNEKAESHYSAKELSTQSIRYGPAAPSYTIDAVYEESTHAISATMQVSFENNFEPEMTSVYFSIWPNAQVFTDGKIDIQEVLSEEKRLPYEVDDTTLKVSELSIPQDQQITLDIAFQVTIPEDKHRFGWSGKQVSLGNWFPILAVHDSHGWNLHPYFDYGESFYSLNGDYDVRFTLPNSIHVVATGEVNETRSVGDQKTHHFTAKNVRDFAAVFYSKRVAKKQRVEDTDIFVYAYDDEEAALIMDAATKSFTTYSELFGPYPWDTLTLTSVDYSENFDGGMEYPQLVMMNTPFLNDEENLAVTVMHEVAHQWFYSLVGNNPYREPWLDESLTTFASYVAYYDTATFDWIDDEPLKYSITSAVSDFAESDMDVYGDIMYDSGALMLSNLHRKLGDEKFYKGLRAYVKEMTFHIATTADFIRIMQEQSGENLEEFFTSHQVFLEETR
ncbi:M1 family peptidase [Sporosarcina sp. PTS2304]|uniref:M1 family metallopeptidase n=1 Tax=Sporosarcina sp. PTS2304 TaxID=2283194 RepID=UPI000E0CF520|nr:M1 family metallopeptidase [Sporosarcina sp. PTS2304]AXH99360.1 M1 family peptidase [Sporosarcina sp. PTS2304]